AQSDFGARLRVVEERKPGVRDRIDRGIDFVKADGIARDSPGRYGSRSQTHDGDPPRPRERVDRQRYTAVRTVVGGRQSALLGGEILESMLDAAVSKLAQGAVGVDDLGDA